jgi:isopentenyl-diphosphate delta-isomerase
MTARESHLVELVDSAGTAIGSTTVSEAHTAPGQLHRAFSVFVRDVEGRVLLQQRAASKTRFPLRWANTACGHPAPGEDLAAAAARRVAEEVGITGVDLTPVGVYAYYAEDPETGRVEYEYDHVLVGDLPAGAAPKPDPAEVADLRWVTVTDLVTDLGTDARAYAPWLAGVTGRLAASSASASSSVPAPTSVPRSSSASASSAVPGSSSVPASPSLSASAFPERTG